MKEISFLSDKVPTNKLVPKIKVNGELSKKLPHSPLKSGIGKGVWYHNSYLVQNYTTGLMQKANNKKKWLRNKRYKYRKKDFRINKWL